MSNESTGSHRDDLFVVGIGASAGGVEALTQLFNHVPKGTTAAFLVITHLGPHRESKLSEILARHTHLAVADAAHGAVIEAGHVYVLPADAILTITDRTISLRPVSAEQRERNPIDICFASLAREYADSAIGIILSGAGIDGSVGRPV